MDQLDQLIKELETLKTKEVRVGLQRGKKHRKKGSKHQTDLVDVALYNEFGTSQIPARPFFAQTVETQGEEISDFAVNLAGKIVDGKLKAESALKKIGSAAKGAVQNQMEIGEFVPNAPATIKRKGSDQPLIDSGVLRQSIQYVIRDKGDDEDV